MHRLLSTCFAIMIFSAFLAGQILFDKFNINAALSKQEDQLVSLYKDNLKSFKDRSFDGIDIDLSNIKAPVVVINFWASWCGPCLEEFPSLVELKKRYGEDDVYIVGINSDTENVDKNIKKIYQNYQLNFPSVLDKNKWTEKFKVNAIPISIIYLGDEVIVSKGARDFTDQKLLKKIDQILQQS